MKIRICWGCGSLEAPLFAVANTGTDGRIGDLIVPGGEGVCLDCVNARCNNSFVRPDEMRVEF